MISTEGQPNIFKERFAKTSEAKIEADKITNTHDNAVDMVNNNVDFFGVGNEEKKSEIATRVFSRFGRGYKDFKDMMADSQNSSKNQRIAFGDIDSLAESVRISMDMSVLGKDLVTESLTAEQIDENLPKEMKGIGKRIREMRLMDWVKKDLVEVNRVIEQNNLFTTQNKVVRGEIHKKLGEKIDILPENSPIKKYVKVARTVLADLGVEDKVNEIKNNTEKPRANYTAAEWSEWLKQDKEAREKAKSEGREDTYKSPIWLMSMEDVVDEEMQQRGKQQFHLNPPYPEWFKQLSQRDKDLWRVRCKLINGVAWKQIIRNKDVDKLMGNEAIDISRAEIKVLFEMPHFKEALDIYFKDLFDKKGPEGDNLLRIKREAAEKGARGTILDSKTEDKLTHFQKYKEVMALRMQYPSKTLEECESLYDKYYDTPNKKGEAKKMLASDEYRSAVGAAWSFLYIGNTLESADSDRQLKPSEVVSDKLRSMIHPLQKAMGKWGIYKEGVVDSSKYDEINGEEEPMGGPIAAWIMHNLEMDKIKGLKADNPESFRYKLKNHEPGYRPLPLRTATSLIEMMLVYHEDEKGHLVMKENKPDLIPMSQAIIEGKKITFDVVKVPKNNEQGKFLYKTKKQAIEDKDNIVSHEFEGHDYDICVGFRDSMDGCKTAYDYLTGSAKLDSKDKKAWSLGFDKNISLIRQNATKYYPGVNGEVAFSHLKFVNQPEFLAWVAAASAGFNYRSEKLVLDSTAIGSNGNNYYYAIENLVNLPGFAPVNVDRKKIMEYLSAKDGPYATRFNISRINSNNSKNERLMSNYNNNYQMRKKEGKEKEDEEKFW